MISLERACIGQGQYNNDWRCMRTLLLDSAFFPVKVINWQKAMILFITGRAEVIDEYLNIDIRSINESFKLPKILRLFSRHKGNKIVRFTRYNVFWRDNFRCQYCRKKFVIGQLTFDHLIPQSRGGDTSWDNIVTACHKCNTKKGAKTLKESGMKLAKQPKRPRWTPELCLKLQQDDPDEWFDWLPRIKASA
jgi:5-methylcytosine-specific restriction endonuclease McrA